MFPSRHGGGDVGLAQEVEGKFGLGKELVSEERGKGSRYACED